MVYCILQIFQKELRIGGKMDMMGSLESKRPDIIVLNREGTFRIKKDLYQTFPALETFLRDYKLRAEIKEINNVTYTIFTKI